MLLSILRRAREVSKRLSESGAGFPPSTVLYYRVSVSFIGLGSVGSDMRTSGCGLQNTVKRRSKLESKPQQLLRPGTCVSKSMAFCRVRCGSAGVSCDTHEL